MLRKIFGKKESNASSIFSRPVTSQSSLKIIHAGGHAENFYMAIPASMIIEKYHSLVLVRPEIFQRPRDSIIRPDEILIPGQKYYLVPRRTVKKLRCRIRRTATDPGAYSQPENSISSISGILVKPGRKVKARDRHVRFNIAIPKPGSVSVHSNKKHGNKEKNNRKPGPMDEENTRARNENAWEPSLHSITE
ncbi:hypothetical protein ACS0TY_017180 [Phlomoides rotata]